MQRLLTWLFLKIPIILCISVANDATFLEDMK